MDNLDEVTEGEVVTKFFLKVGKLCKSFFVWAWNLEGDDISEYVLGSLFIVIVAAIGVALFTVLVVLCWLTVNVDWKWVFSVPPAIGLVALGEVRVVKGVVALYKDFF